MGITKEKKVIILKEKLSEKKRGRPPLKVIKVPCEIVKVNMDYVKKVNNLILEGNCAENWKKFKQNYDIFEVAAEIDIKSEPIRIATFLNTIGPEALEVYNAFDLTADNRKKLVKIFEAFEQFCEGRVNETYERFNFFQRKQKDGEPFNDFLMNIRKLVKSCGFGELSASLLKDQIVRGVCSESTRQDLLKMKDLDYTKAVDLCRACESSSHQVKEMQPTGVMVDAVNSGESGGRNTSRNYESEAGTSTNYNQRNSRSNNFNQNFNFNRRFVTRGRGFINNRYKGVNENNNNNFFCLNCNQSHNSRSCPAFGKKCSNCFKFNHFAVSCNAKNVKSITFKEDEDEIDQMFVHSINEFENYKDFNCSRKYWKEALRIDDTFVDFKLDTGSEVNILPMKILDKVCKDAVIRSTSLVLKAYGGHTIVPLGVSSLVTIFRNEICLEEFVIIEEDLVPIIGFPTCTKLNIIAKVESIDSEIIEKKSNRSEDQGMQKRNFIVKHKVQFTGLGKFSKKHCIELKEGSHRESVVKPPRRVPLKIKEKLKGKLNQMVENKIIDRVDEARDWVHNMVIVEKLNGDLRICLDPRDLNRCLKPSKYLIPTVDEISMQLHGAKFFSVLDLKDGFWQVDLEPESRKLLTFSTPFGNYQFNRLAFGLSTSAEVFQKYNNESFGDIPGVTVYIDDILVTGTTIEEHDKNLDLVMERARKLNVKFNPSKFQYRIEEVSYLGFNFNAEGRTIDESRIKSIKELKNPKDKKDLQKFLGVINYLRSFIPNLAEITTPLRTLLKKNVIFQWEKIHSEAVDKIKESIVNAPVLHTFDPNLDIVIQTDASKNGLGCCLFQNNKLISCSSRRLSDTEQMYAQIEKEFLAVVFSTIKFRDYIYGRSIVVQSDHRPLVSIMKKEIHKIPSSKLQRMRLRLMNFDIKLEYIPGKYLHLADYLSRYFLENKSSEEENVFTESVLSIDVSEEKILRFQNESKEDETLKLLLTMCQVGWPNDKSKVDDKIKLYFKMREEIFVEDGILYLGNRIIVPKSLRKEMLMLLHESHQGITKTKGRAKEIFYWPNINTDIEECVSKCMKCQTFRNNIPNERMIPHEIPELPFYKIACDILEHESKIFLVMVDYYSKWIELKEIKNKSSKEVIRCWLEVFCIFGVPKMIIADNVPFNSYECREFANKWNSEIITTSPYHHRSNGLAERGVQIVKNILKKSDTSEEILIGLMEYRNTPSKDIIFSPAQLLQSRRLRTKIPTSLNMLKPKMNEGVSELMRKKTLNNEKYFNKNIRDRKEFADNQKIFIRKDDVWVPGTIVNKFTTPRSYMVRDENNRSYRRNSQFLKTNFVNQDSNQLNEKKVDDNDMKRTRSGRSYN